MMGLTACGGGSSSTGQVAGGAFSLIRAEPSDNGRVFLNQTVRFTFSNPVDLNTVNFNSVIFVVRDASGTAVPETVVGTFAVGLNSDGKPDPRLLTFKPRLPTNDSYTNGGFKPGRSYQIIFAGSQSATAQTVRDVSGRSLSPNSPIKQLTLLAPTGTEPSQLFLDQKVGGPRVTSVDVSPLIGSRVSLNKLGDVPVEVSLRFNQPVDPAMTNVPKDQNQDPLQANSRTKGKIFLEYDDPEFGPSTWIRTQVSLDSNTSKGALITLRPDAVLPNNAEIRVVVLAEFRDIAGETNIQDSSYRQVVGKFRTEAAFGSQFDAIAFNLAKTEIFDREASYRDPVAEITNGIVRASFNFEGIDTPFDYGPSSDVVLNTKFTVVQPKNGNKLPVSGGVFPFRNIHIPQGVRVSASGPNPAVFLATGKVKIEGTLSVDGGDGEGAVAINSANMPSKGGVGNAGGGNGGRASQNTSDSTAQGETGEGPGNEVGAGGEGGSISCGPIQAGYVGSGGGGGAFATQGDTDFYSFSSDPIVAGNGGKGLGNKGDVRGGKPGSLVFSDDNPNNNFWGRQVTKDGKVYHGELKAPRGGNAGGGGGDRTSAASCFAGPASFFNDERGGGGGAGGGVLIIKSLGKIEVTQTGLISSNGGNGGGGEPNASNLQAGGGGGGSGGMVILMSATSIELWQHGDPWKAPARDSRFAVTADGGIGLSNPVRTEKYVSSNPGEKNRGGFGGMGVVQFMVPPGSDADGTGNVQDDNIHIIDKVGKPISGAQKTEWIYQGDVRPRPIVMPVPYSRFSQVRTRWIATGATLRRQVTNTGPGARAILSPAVPGPDYFFSGIQTAGKTAGYVATDPATGQYSPAPIPLGPQNLKVVQLASAPVSGVHRGQPVYELALSQGVLPSDGSYANYRAYLHGAHNKVLGEFRIVGHSSSVCFLDRNDGALPEGILGLSIHAKFFDVLTPDANNVLKPGLGETFAMSNALHPATTLQLGFAFHKNPSNPDLYQLGGKSYDRNRFPQELGTFARDLASSSARAALAKLQYPFAKLQVRFNLNYNPKDPDNLAGPNPVSPSSTRIPQLHKILLPYRF